jgi:hypothetical protein
MSQQFFHDRRPHQGLTYAAYLQIMEQQAGQATAGLSEEEIERIQFTRLNLHRTQRIARTYEVSTELAALLGRIQQPQLWMVLTEPWCGDSAQCLPHIATMAAQNSAIDLRILLRDENLDIMDLYLTAGNRSIPQLVALATDGQELWRWGPRPVEAQALFTEAKSVGLEKPQIMEKLHLWYGRNRGKTLESEFIALLSS